MNDGVWQLDLKVPAAAEEAIENCLLEWDESAPGAVAKRAMPDEDGNTAMCCVFTARPNAAALSDALELISAERGLPGIPMRLSFVADRDWVTDTQKLHQPISAGRFFIHPGHWQGAAPAGSVALRVDAGQAFGTGAHETTRGCLVVLDRLAQDGAAVRRALDVGCGSGILAMAVERAFGARVVASDIDPVAIATARESARLNRIDGIAFVVADGFGGEAVAAAAPYDLIIMNILAGPVIAFAPAAARHLHGGGIAIVSGILAEQESDVMEAYAAAGFECVVRHIIGDWPTLNFTLSCRAAG